MFEYAATEILDLICRTYFYGIWKMGMKDRFLINIMNPTLIALIAMAIHHCPLAWTMGEFRIFAEFGQEGRVQCKCNTRSINNTVNTTCTEVLCCLDVDFPTSLPEVQLNGRVNRYSMIRWRTHSTGTDPVMAQPHNDRVSVDENILDFVLEELIE